MKFVVVLLSVAYGIVGENNTKHTRSTFVIRNFEKLSAPCGIKYSTAPNPGTSGPLPLRLSVLINICRGSIVLPCKRMASVASGPDHGTRPERLETRYTVV